jgi:tetratricopeptide (TPR) repeat protein
VFAQALKVQPQFVPAYLARGDLYRLQGQPEQALAEYQEAVWTAPTVALAHVKMGSLYEAQHHPEEAVHA